MKVHLERKWIWIKYALSTMWGLKNVLFDGWELESTLKRKEIDLQSTLSDEWGWENTLKTKWIRLESIILGMQGLENVLEKKRYG